uniref:Uncharacterized protein n=1 Tax=Oryza sativa subsp. japonica TaxID=39947 RepID=Q6Z6R8_ORYSJ|nr:unknown protein [Oryza sativa Japonica Group]
MSAGGAFGGNRGVRPVPPEKGVFPLDHLHECDLVSLYFEAKGLVGDILMLVVANFKRNQTVLLIPEILAVLRVLKNFDIPTYLFRLTSRNIEENLMAKQDMSELGFRSEDVMNPSPNKKNNLESSASGPNEER